jgi:transcriptional regulator GlxA family with amidase domain
VTDLPIDVHFVLMDDSLLLDWAGPAEALRIANGWRQKHGQTPAFSLHFVGPHSLARSSVGAQVTALAPLPKLSNTSRPQWVVLVGLSGDRLALDSAHARELLHWLRGLQLEQNRVELMCICAGAVIAAHAGLLAGRQVTTHHHHLDELKQVAPDCIVLSNRVFVLDPPLSSSAGVTTGIDLFLHRIVSVCGPALAAQVAQTMVVAMRRGPNDPELSPFLRHRDHMHPALHRVQDAVSQRPQEPWSAQAMASVACTSPRHLNRIFLTHAGITPSDYVRNIRLDLAQAALLNGCTVGQAAEMAGFSSDTQLRSAWHRQGRQGTPGECRRG